MSRYSSRVFAVGSALHAALAAKTWPLNPGLDERPKVMFSDEDPDVPESICVALNADATSSEWRRLSPPGRDETITFDVTCRSFVPSVDTSTAVWMRLAALADVAESVVFDTAAQKVVPLGVDGEALLGLSTGTRPVVFPSGGGWLGLVVVSFRFQAQI